MIDINKSLDDNIRECERQWFEVGDLSCNAFEYMLSQLKRVQELEEDYVILGVEQEEKLMDELEDLRKRNKRYREAIEYVITAKPIHYENLENALVDIKYVIIETLEEESK